MAAGDGGGVGNERGSVHRRGLAVLLAANGLVGRGLPLPSGEVFVPERLEFETDEATDDVTCLAVSGRRVFFSAKRTCGDDEKNLGKTVAQWVAQARSLRPGDVLGLATAQLTGDMQHIRAALQRHHHQLGTAGPVDEQKALTALKGRINAATADQALRDSVLDAAYVLVVSAVDSEDEDFHVAADRLENTIVPAGQGMAAAQALSQAFHTQASRKSGSGVADWVRILRDDAELTVFSDATGPAGAAENARQIALYGYAARLGEQLGRIELSLLAEDVEPLTVAGLADGLRVVVPGSDVRSGLREPERATRQWLQPEQEPLLAVARRWPRFLLTGLPGMGKSTALRQLAARWATDDDAPMPILVPLPGVADRCKQAGEVTLRMLCEVAAAQATPAGQPADLVAALEGACQDGHAVLLLDAFDEVGHRRPILADGIKSVLAKLPPQVGAVLATRDSGLQAAARLDLPEAHLASPANLETVLDQLLVHVAAIRVADPAERDSWIVERRSWSRAARRTHRGIAEVPLLAMLMTLVVADSGGAPVAPRGEAELLVTAVERSVLRWEQRRSHTVGARPGEPSSRQLLDGFAAVGSLLAGSGSVSCAEAEQAVAAVLAQQWGAAPGRARELTAHILQFWDEHVGVFVDRDGHIEARSRVFAEIGAAMALNWLSDADLAAWVQAAVSDPDRGTALLLAGEVDRRVLSSLLTDDGDAGARALSAAMVVRRRTDVDDAQRGALLQLLIGAAEHAPTSAEDPRTPESQRWTYVAEVAFLCLPHGLRSRRRQALADQCADDDERLLTAALVALADAAADGQPLNAAQVTAVREALTLGAAEGPDRLAPANGRRRLREAWLRIAQEAIAHLPDLGDDMVPHIRDLARRGRRGAYADIENALLARGYERETPAPGARVAAQIDELLGGIERDQQVLPLLHCAQRVAPAGEMSASQRWRLPQLCAVFDLIDVRGADVDGFLAFGAEPVGAQVGWMTAVATAAGLDLPALAAQGQAAIAEQARGQQPTVWAVLTAPAPGPPPTVDAGRLSPRDADMLLDALIGGSQWMAESARRALWDYTDDHLGDRLRAALDHLRADRRAPVAELARRVSTTSQDGGL